MTDFIINVWFKIYSTLAYRQLVVTYYTFNLSHSYYVSYLAVIKGFLSSEELYEICFNPFEESVIRTMICDYSIADP
jgi:hypothetical protein